jgi:hypothetical protein
MWHKTIAMIALAAFCITSAGCYRKELLSKWELKPGEQYRIVEAVLSSGQVIHFVSPSVWHEQRAVAEPGWASISDSLLTGWTHENGEYEQVSVPLSQVYAVMVRKVDVGQTIIATFGYTLLIGIVVGLIVLATKESCPFIYASDGERYWFDGEPYGGATCPALQRTDLCRLDSLRAVQGKYRLLLTNEVNETQHTDQLKLWLVDHSPAVQVIPDAGGNLHTLASLQPPLRVTDARGSDLTLWCRSNDALWWESGLKSRDPQDSTALRDSLTLCFVRPPGARQAKLAANVGTTLWGSQMLQRAESLWGGALAQWQDSLRNPRVRSALDAWDRREEAYVLQVRVWTGNEWTVGGELLGGGPFVSEDRVVPLDLDGVAGDTLRILLTPATGFWQMNWLAVDYSPEAPVSVREIAADSAVGHDGNDLRAALDSVDGIYYTAPDVGQTARLSFLVPPVAAGETRTVFAKVSGYYDIHHPEVGARQDSLLRRIWEEPGFYARFARDEYGRWRAGSLTWQQK